MAIDTKGGHFIVEDAERKLFYIERTGRGTKLTIRLVTQGQWHAKSGEIRKIAGSDYETSKRNDKRRTGDR